MSTSRYARDIDLEDRNNAHTLGILSIPPGSRVLDIGTADGSVARGLVERGCKVWGVEVDPDSAREAEQLCQQVVVGDIETLDIATAFDGVEFDAVLLLDVLEHLRDPLPVLRKCAAMVGGEGRLVVSIPNVAHAAVKLALLGGHFSYTERGLLDETHLRFFDKAAVDRLLAAADLRVEEELRTTCGLTETEIPIQPDSFPAEVVAEAIKDAESETYQFIVVAAPKHGGAKAASTGTPEVSSEPRRGGAPEAPAIEREQLEAAKREVRFLHQDLRLKETYLIRLRNQSAAREQMLQAELDAHRGALEDILRSPSWRITSPLRWLKGRLRG